MKTFKGHYVALLLLAIVMLPACNTDTDDPFAARECLITATVDGSEFRWELASCSYVEETLSVGNINFDEALFKLGPITAPGVFTSTDPGLKLGLTLTLSSDLQIEAADIRIDVDTFTDDRAEGTFSGLFNDIDGNLYEVENGRFTADL